MSLLEVAKLRCELQTDTGARTVVDEVSLQLEQGESLGLVGESGCGKSMTALAIMRLLPQPGGRISSGRVTFNGETVADSRRALLLLERNHAPVYYLPRADANMDILKRTDHSSH